jgi:large subunit ribosomal protein L23
MSKLGKTTKLKTALLSKPRITEKATWAEGANSSVYTFEVSPQTNKTQIKEAIKDKYGVSPLKVNMVALPAKAVMNRRIHGFKGAVKKALVFLKPGDKIDNL